MGPIDPTLSLEAARLAAAPSRGLTSRTPAASQGCPRGGAALTFSDAALLGREAQLLQHGGTHEEYMCSPTRLPTEEMP